MSCDEIRPHTSYKKLFEYHRSRFPKVKVLHNHKEFKETSAICLQELLKLDKKDILGNEIFRKKIEYFVGHIPRYYEKKFQNKHRMFATHRRYFESEFNILPSNHIQANKIDKDCVNFVVKVHTNSNDISNDIPNYISNGISNDVTNDISGDISNDISNKFKNSEPELDLDLVNSLENLDDMTNNIEQETQDNYSKLDISEEFLSKIIKTVDELCDDIKNGDPDIKRMLEVNLNLSSAVSCYKSMLSLKKQNIVPKKNEELVNQMPKEKMAGPQTRVLG